jgi:hypothetical protein
MQELISKARTLGEMAVLLGMERSMSKCADRFGGGDVQGRLDRQRTPGKREWQPTRAALLGNIEFIRPGEDTRGVEDEEEVAEASESPARYFYVDGFPVPLTFGPSTLPCVGLARRPSPLRFPGLRKLALLALTGSFVIIIAVIVARTLPGPPLHFGRGLAPIVSSATHVDTGTGNQRSTPSQVIVDQISSGSDVTLPLGASLRGALEGTNLTVAGVPPGATISPARQIRSGHWRVEAKEIGDVTVHPPQGFVGKMNLVLELRRANGTIVDREFVRLGWGSAQKDLLSADVRSPTVPGLNVAAKLPRGTAINQLSQYEISVLLIRGEEYLKAGQITAARLVLQRAANAHDSRGALLLGESYNPLVLQKLGVLGLVADADKARIWYEKAKEFGSIEAPQRIETLSFRNH